jgi:hypothetical protein
MKATTASSAAQRSDQSAANHKAGSKNESMICLMGTVSWICGLAA